MTSTNKDSVQTSSLNESLIELSYSKWADHYSKKNWLSNYPTWSTLTDDDKEFWTRLVLGIRGGYRRELIKASKEDHCKSDREQ